MAACVLKRSTSKGVNTHLWVQYLTVWILKTNHVNAGVKLLQLNSCHLAALGWSMHRDTIPIVICCVHQTAEHAWFAGEHLLSLMWIMMQ